jgi:hypothetical protein
MNPTNVTWISDWAWSLPLIVLTVVIHVCGLALIAERMVGVLSVSHAGRNFTVRFAAVMGATALLATVLHGIEGATWAVAYRILAALPDNRSAMLYSLSAMTTYGHAKLVSRESLAVDGRFGGVRRHAAIRDNDGFSVRHNPEGLATR